MAEFMEWRNLLADGPRRALNQYVEACEALDRLVGLVGSSTRAAQARTAIADLHHVMDALAAAAQGQLDLSDAVVPTVSPTTPEFSAERWADWQYCPRCGRGLIGTPQGRSCPIHDGFPL